jgi:hypothetical protein
MISVTLSLLLAAANQAPPPPPPPPRLPAASRRVRLRWGPPAAVVSTKSVHDLSGPVAAKKKSRNVGGFSRRILGRSLVLRLMPPQFIYWIGGSFDSFGVATGIEFKLGGQHIVSISGEMGGKLYGLGVAYLREIELVQNAVYAELGATLGYFSVRTRSYDSELGRDEYSSDASLVHLNARIAAGYRWVFLHLGPKVSVFPVIALGLQGGLMLQF